MPVFDGDFGFVGGWNATADPYQDSQTLINWYPEVDPDKGGKTAIALLGCPGLVEVASVTDAA